MSNATIPWRFVKNVTQNGVGRHICQLQRLTISFCKEHNSSRGTRDFIENYLLDFTRANPGIVVYLKPRRHRKPYIQADYLNGYTEKINISCESQEIVCQWIGQMRGRSGVQVQKLLKDWHTDTPSVQGVWHPFLFKDTKLSVADMRDKSLHEFRPLKKSATEKVQKLYDELTKQDSVEEVVVQEKIQAASSS